ncbi:heparan sulfate glucosamine 3-O-sulfotransferase 5-like [Corticium candelabrum]|uniref:heparan sulfate glucosamine 3-O-sulfotransferase 5-like n=1 Tax=Corticium candelabrum TaxID=121492 RepID=UPI002E258302|nr:heparan sulfate glucosamine 3-O-sulfotransferase 5-like [Corticium candelabrum]XP_062523219.1 heparan sulfate glucosamine 3-O-sulfotransferase 5-like [Corticium candelabrum]
MLSRRRRYIVFCLLWLSAIVLLKLLKSSPKDEPLDVSRGHASQIVLTERKATGLPKETGNDRMPIRVDSENEHAPEKLKSKMLRDEIEGLAERSKNVKVSIPSDKSKSVEKLNSQTKDKIRREVVDFNKISDVKSERKALGVKKQTQQENELKRRFPHIIMIGVGKTGTRAVYEMIQMHPAIRGPLKEIRYFDRNFNLGIEWYMGMMPQTYTWQETIEKSPGYIRSRDTPVRLLAAMRQFNRTRVRLVLVVRDPFTRAVSEYLEWKWLRMRTKVTLLPFDKLVLDKNGEVDINCPPINTSIYIYHLNYWLKYFSIKDFCFVSGEMIVADPYSEMQQLEQCLGLRSYLSKDNFVYVPQRGFYCLRNHGRSWCMNKSKGRKHPEVEKSVENKLRAFYAPYNKKLYEITGRDFGWT